MIFFDKTRTIGQDANGKNVVWVSVYVDTAANLPAYNDYQSDGFILCMASEGRCIDTGDLYRLDSAGTWQISQAGTGTYTKAEIDALLNAKQDVLTFDATPTQDSINPITSGGVWAALQSKITIDDVYGLGAPIPENSDIDTYKTIGVYNVASAAVASTVSNLPTTSAGRLEVKALNALNRYLQIYYATNNVYQRRWTGTVWTTWYQYTLTAI